MPSFVYVLMHVSGKRFKIGKAIDIESSRLLKNLLRPSSAQGR